jgi:hypothetical protein
MSPAGIEVGDKMYFQTFPFNSHTAVAFRSLIAFFLEGEGLLDFNQEKDVGGRINNHTS